ncbi:1-aminocyclopropane-1-carboxylate deaminase [Bathymodiolus japonicus methanotrophic gill symbiont]|uniref:1-aminocyclopropane-1-carboxylate deaminase/D-cysteine desulfhydrase n=1 Tax=Bathymodiolus japonicus methanotrophic gill symbiont TaxID=113269 RepID=UPI001B54214E|nr:pyridoxal-phosphate dependent enzyme [Bathymodiolus japonicus methanotrophic gill symbiont]GFO71980.1 1-aminocyclopropane-1-carboxylate deaminase [Bathymodiolus japonicus methanotrophic gill symbiont]
MRCHSIPARLFLWGWAYSNHLYALAYAGHELGIETLGIIRGERPETLNPSLSDMQAWGMALELVSRSDYRQLRTYKQNNAFPGLSPGEYWLPEGGALNLALQEVAELVAEIDIDYDVLCVPCGTATTMAGLVNAVAGQKQVHGFAALKGAGFLKDELDNFLAHSAGSSFDWSIHLQYHFGGFAKISSELLHFIQQFEQTHNIKLEPVYTGKMLYGIYDLIRLGYFKSGQKIIAIHTGGLQGNRGFVSVPI